MVINIHFPYCISVAEKVKGIFEQHRVAEDTVSITTELSKKKHDIRRLDSLLQIQIQRESEVKNGIVEALYIFSDSARLKTAKVEVGARVAANNRHETSISVSGTGSYSSIGKFVENIENYQKSTRVRQLVLNGTPKKDIEALVDFVLME